MINIEQNNDILKISYVNKNGDIAFEDIKIPQSELFEWEVTNRNGVCGVTTWDNQQVKCKKTRVLNSYRVVEFLNQQSQEIKDRIFSFNEPNKYFVDIETDSSEEFWKPDNPQGEIQTISIVPGNKDIAMVLSTKQLSKERQKNVEVRLNKHFEKFNTNITFKFVYFATEYEMLYSFFDQAMKKMTFLSGWNFIDFDWSYLVERAKLLGINPSISSPTLKLHTKHKIPLHRIVVDYLEIYKKWDKKIEVKERNSLDWVSKTALGITKIPYNGTLSNLYNNDFESFVLYNAVDSVLVKYLDRELNTAMIYLYLSHLTQCEHQKAWSPVFMTEAVLIKKLLERNKILLYRAQKEDDADQGYSGAYVKDPVLGLHEYLATLDYSSEYPTNIRQWNISTDVFLGVDKDLDPNLHPDVIKCANGAIFKRNEDGALREIAAEFFAKRKKAKIIAKKAGKEIRELENMLSKF